MMKKITTLLFIFFTVFNISSAQAESARVIEIQEKIKTDISDFLEKFSPNTKYSVQVKVKPLRRRYDQSSRNEDLPFMEFQEDLILDEWDDPKVNVYSLYSRISEARVTIFIEDKVTIENRSKFKEALLLDVNLVPGRDSIAIEAISTPVLETAFNWKDQTQTLLLGVMLIIAVVLGVGLNSLSKKIIPQQGANNSVNKDNAASAVTPPVMSPMASVPSSGNDGGGFNNLKGDLSIQDPSQINSVVAKKITKLLASDFFPTLSDMIIFEELLKNDPSSFSYLVYEFPQDVQKSIYQRGKGELWFKGFSDVGFPSKVVLISLDKMLRNRIVHENKKFESLLIHTWRLSKDLTKFIKSVQKEEAFSILYYLPKDISIPVARKCFPGSWGEILEDRPINKLSDTKKIEQLVTEVLRLQPYFNYESLQIFKNRKDLLAYLDTVEPHEEKDIYSVMGDDNNLSFVRPPFYTFFELKLEDRADVYNKFSMNEWAVACFNIDRSDKDVITELMDEKEKYLFSHSLKNIDQNPALAINKIEIRKIISRYIFDHYAATPDSAESPKSELNLVDDENKVA
jgi:hypothetical protein